MSHVIHEYSIIERWAILTILATIIQPSRTSRKRISGKPLRTHSNTLENVKVTTVYPVSPVLFYF